MPVLLQWVVGEHEGSPVVSCVAYSRERQGNTQGVSSLQCNYGHGKSVVDSMFPVDTYYIDDATKASYSVIRVKTKRMVPHFGARLELKEETNDVNKQKKPALNPDARQAIHMTAIALEAAYGRPMDIELVTDQAKKIIYLVQARPVVYDPKKVELLYVASTVNFDDKKTVRCEKIYVTGTVYLLKSDDILVTDNLESGLSSVQESQKNKQHIPQVIVVKESGAITSHAGATLAGEGIVLLQRDNQKPLRDLLAAKEHNFLVDSQRGLIVDITDDTRFASKDLATLRREGLVIEGWYGHPIPAVMRSMRACVMILIRSRTVYQTRRYVNR